MRISLIENWPFLQFLKRYVWNPMVIKQNFSTSRLYWYQIMISILCRAVPFRECWSSMELNLCLKCSRALGSLAKSPLACLSLLCKAAFSPVEQCGDNAGRIPMLPASSCWQKHFFWFSQFPRMTVLTKLVVIEDWAYFEDQLLSGAPDTFFMKIRKFTETRPQLVIESPITQSDVRQRLKVVWHLYRVRLKGDFVWSKTTSAQTLSCYKRSVAPFYLIEKYQLSPFM